MKKSVSLTVAVLVVAGALVACQFTSLVPTALPVIPTQAPAMPTQGNASPAPQTIVNLVDQQDRLVAIYDQVNPGVVTIKTSTGLGSGWVYSSDGYLVTNAHVVQGETRVEVDFTAGQKVYGDVKATDQYSDLAVVKIDPSGLNLQPLPLGDSNTIKVGQIVVAIGNPWGLNGTMTTGVVSALGRELQSGPQTSTGGTFGSGDIIQTDASLNPGNSGGPLLNLNGEVIGITDAIRSDAATAAGEPVNAGVGFAISVNTIKRVIPSLISKGRVDYPYLGITAYSNLDSPDMPLDLINALGLKSTYGAYVTGVTSGGPADRAGLRGGTTPLTAPGYRGIDSGGDLIIAADGQKIYNYDSLITFLALHKSPGDTVTLTVLRGDQKLDIPVVLGTRPAQP
jgi:2-alkenal reductase